MRSPATESLRVRCTDTSWQVEGRGSGSGFACRGQFGSRVGNPIGRFCGTRVPEAKLVEVPPRKFNDPTSLAPYLPRDGDILHVHFPLKRGPDAMPFVQTIHRNLKPGSPLSPNTIFLSRDHARRHGSGLFVYNGLDPAEYFFRRFPKRPEQYDLFLGKAHRP